MKIMFWTVLLLSWCTPLWAMGLQAVNTDKPIQLLSVDYDLEVHDIYVAGVMETRFIAAYGDGYEANFRFPLPPDSVLHKAEIYLPEQKRWAAAETMGRREGQQIYEEVTETNQDPLLIQRIGQDFYRARVFPVGADGELRMRVYYAHTLELRDTGYQLRIAFANPDASAATPARGVQVNLHTDAAYWQPAQWELAQTWGHEATGNLATGSAALTLYDATLDTDVLLPLQANTEKSIPAANLSYQPQSNTLQPHTHIWWQPDFSAYPDLLAQPRNIVFVIDVSGSMSGEKIVQTRQAIVRTLDKLDEADYFGLVAFSSGVYVFDEQMRSGADKDEAKQWVSNLNASGGTGMSAGLQRAAEIGMTSPLSSAEIDLMMMTDGRPNEGSDTVMDILADMGAKAEQLGRSIRMFTIGIGYNLDQDLLNGLAQQSSGESTFALDDSEITGQVLDLFGRIRGGGLSNAKLTMLADTATPATLTMVTADATPSTITWSRVFPDTVLAAGHVGRVPTQLMLTGHAPDFASVTLGVSLPIPLSVPTDFARIAAPLTAKALADQLERQVDQEGETDALVAEAVRLARTYGIVTRYSSLLALDSDALYAEHGVQRVERDLAGIALDPITDSTVDEGRIGGTGTNDTQDKGSSTSYTPPVADAADAAPTTFGESESADYDDDYTESEYACEPGLFDAKQRLYLPFVLVGETAYWASLKYVSNGTEIGFEIVTYGLVDEADYWKWSEDCVAELAFDWHLSIAQVKNVLDEHIFRAIEMTPIPNSAPMRFKLESVR